MTMQMFLFRELLGSIRTKSAAFFAFAWVLLFLFLASVACFFMISPSSVARSTEGQPIEEIHVYLSPTLSSDTINQWFLDWRERETVERINLIFAQELNGTATGKVFIIKPTAPEMSGAIAAEFRRINGVTKVVEVPRELAIMTPSVSLVIRISLLAILVATIAASLFCFRRGFHELLTSFSGEIRMLRLSGIAKHVVPTLVVALGVLMGLLSGLFLLATLYLFHQIALANTAAFSLLGGLINGLRILGVGMTVLALGTVLGGLAGLLGASLLHGREFNALP
jgi:cell division protein FtsX